MFFGRKKELAVLEKRYNSDKFEFGFVYGQRRIGKTSLLDEFEKSRRALMFFASDSDDVSIRRDFSNILFNYLGQPSMSAFDNWESFFLGLKNAFGNEKAMIVFDEYPNIIMGHDGKRKKTDFDEKLQNAIDHLFKDTNLSIVIMGSNVSFMEKLINNKTGPLYKRHTFSLFLSKLEWDDALKFVEGMPLDDKIKTLSMTDTYPYYLSHINPHESFEDNLNNFFFNMDSLIISDPTFTISSNMGITGFYVGIMRCLSQRINTIKDISNALNSESGKVTIYLNELLNAGVITKSTYFNSERNTYYEINDRMTSFFFRFVQPYIEQIKLGNGLRIREREENAIDNFVHHAYEKLCITYLHDLNNKGKLEQFYLSFSNFKADNTSLGRSVEIDIVSEEKKSLLIGECKYSNKKKGIEEYEKMKEDASIKPFDQYINKHFYLFSHSGFTDKLLSCKDKNLHLISSKDMVKQCDWFSYIVKNVGGASGITGKFSVKTSTSIIETQADLESSLAPKFNIAPSAA